MTQLFDTSDYVDPNPTDVNEPVRHLRSLPNLDDSSDRPISWRLDETTIEIGRRGIELARQALRSSGRDTSPDESDDDSSPSRRAA